MNNKNIDLSPKTCEKLDILNNKFETMSVTDKCETYFGFPMICQYGDIYIPTLCGGRVWCSFDEVEEFIDGLYKYVLLFNDDEIEEINDFIWEQKYNNHSSIKRNKKTKKKKPGYIYLFKCQDKYKIGYTNNVERRLNELNKRPFEMECLKKIYSEDAYHIEQEIHSQLKYKAIENEWYDDMSIDEFISLVKDVAEKNKVSIQIYE